jgi:hypothetical protein
LPSSAGVIHATGPALDDAWLTLLEEFWLILLAAILLLELAMELVAWLALLAMLDERATELSPPLLLPPPPQAVMTNTLTHNNNKFLDFLSALEIFIIFNLVIINFLHRPAEWPIHLKNPLDNDNPIFSFAI